MNELRNRSPFGNIGGIIVVILVLIGLYYMVSGIFWLLYQIAPLMLIGALILNYKVVTDFVKYVWKTLGENPLFGVAMIIFSVFAYPLVFAYLLAKAYTSRGKELNDENEFEEYEDLSENALDLDDLERNQQEKMENLDDYFKE
jgi:predicted membrane protein